MRFDFGIVQPNAEVDRLTPAGSETTISVLNFMFLALVLHPEVQRQAQKEREDHLVHGGHIRLPDAEDAKHLPFLRAIVKEILR